MIELPTGKVARCVCIPAQCATFDDSGATGRATVNAITTLKAASLLVLQRNSNATTPEKQRNFDPQKMVEKLRRVADEIIGATARNYRLEPEQLRHELHAEFGSDDEIAVALTDPDERQGLECLAQIMAGVFRKAAKMKDFTERAAILEYDGGMGREQAEAEAFRLVFCRDCAHWTPDSINPPQGLGECTQRAAGKLPLPWPGATCLKGQQKRST